MKNMLLTRAGTELLGTAHADGESRYWIGYYGLAYVADRENDTLSMAAQSGQLTQHGDHIYNIWQGDMLNGYAMSNPEAEDANAGASLFGLTLYDKSIRTNYRYVYDADNGRNRLVAWKSVSGGNGENTLERKGAAVYYGATVDSDSGIPLPAPLYYGGEPSDATIVTSSQGTEGVPVSADYRYYVGTREGGEYGWQSSSATQEHETVSDDTLLGSISNFNKYHGTASSEGYGVSSVSSCHNMSRATKLFPISYYNVVNDNRAKLAETQYSANSPARKPLATAIKFSIDLSPVTADTGYTALEYEDGGTADDQAVEEKELYSSKYVSFRFNRIGIYAVPMTVHRYSTDTATDACSLQKVQFEIDADAEPVLFAVADVNDTVISDNPSAEEGGVARFTLDFILNIGNDDTETAVEQRTAVYYNLYENDATTWYKNQLLASASISEAVTDLSLEMNAIKQQVGDARECCNQDLDLDKYALKNHTHDYLKNLVDGYDRPGSVRGVFTCPEGDGSDIASVTGMAENAPAGTARAAIIPEVAADIDGTTVEMAASYGYGTGYVGSGNVPFAVLIQENEFRAIVATLGVQWLVDNLAVGTGYMPQGSSTATDTEHLYAWLTPASVIKVDLSSADVEVIPYDMVAQPMYIAFVTKPLVPEPLYANGYSEGKCSLVLGDNTAAKGDYSLVQGNAVHSDGERATILGSEMVRNDGEGAFVAGSENADLKDSKIAVLASTNVKLEDGKGLMVGSDTVTAEDSDVLAFKLSNAKVTGSSVAIIDTDNVDIKTAKQSLFFGCSGDDNATTRVALGYATGSIMSGKFITEGNDFGFDNGFYRSIAISTPRVTGVHGAKGRVYGSILMGDATFGDNSTANISVVESVVIRGIVQGDQTTDTPASRIFGNVGKSLILGEGIGSANGTESTFVSVPSDDERIDVSGSILVDANMHRYREPWTNGERVWIGDGQGSVPKSTYSLVMGAHVHKGIKCSILLGQGPSIYGSVSVGRFSSNDAQMVGYSSVAQATEGGIVIGANTEVGCSMRESIIMGNSCHYPASMYTTLAIGDANYLIPGIYNDVTYTIDEFNGKYDGVNYKYNLSSQYYIIIGDGTIQAYREGSGWGSYQLSGASDHTYNVYIDPNGRAIVDDCTVDTYYISDYPQYTTANPNSVSGHNYKVWWNSDGTYDLHTEGQYVVDNNTDEEDYVYANPKVGDQWTRVTIPAKSKVAGFLLLKEADSKYRMYYKGCDVRRTGIGELRYNRYNTCNYGMVMMVGNANNIYARPKDAGSPIRFLDTIGNSNASENIHLNNVQLRGSGIHLRSKGSIGPVGYQTQDDGHRVPLYPTMHSVSIFGDGFNLGLGSADPFGTRDYQNAFIFLDGRYDCSDVGVFEHPTVYDTVPSVTNPNSTWKLHEEATTVEYSKPDTLSKFVVNQMVFSNYKEAATAAGMGPQWEAYKAGGSLPTSGWDAVTRAAEAAESENDEYLGWDRKFNGDTLLDNWFRNKTRAEIREMINKPDVPMIYTGGIALCGRPTGKGDGSDNYGLLKLGAGGGRTSLPVAYIAAYDPTNWIGDTGHKLGHLIGPVPVVGTKTCPYAGMTLAVGNEQEMDGTLHILLRKKDDPFHYPTDDDKGSKVLYGDAEWRTAPTERVVCLGTKYNGYFEMNEAYSGKWYTDINPILQRSATYLASSGNTLLSPVGYNYFLYADNKEISVYAYSSTRDQVVRDGSIRFEPLVNVAEYWSTHQKPDEANCSDPEVFRCMEDMLKKGLPFSVRYRALNDTHVSMVLHVYAISSNHYCCTCYDSDFNKKYIHCEDVPESTQYAAYVWVAGA